MARRMTLADLRTLKGKRQIVTLHVDDHREASAAASAGIEMLTCEVDAMLPRIRAAAPMVFIQAAHTQGTLASEESAIRAGFKALEMGADAIYFAGSLRLVEAKAREGIPVSGHVGLVPRWATWTNYRAIGKTVKEAVALYHRIKGYENTGAALVEMEVVPVEVADWLTKSTALITEGMGCGNVCDTQYMFSCDVLGSHTGHYLRHAKRYADLAAEQARLQHMRREAFRAFADDVKAGGYPEPRHEIRLDESMVDAARAKLRP